MATNTTLSVYLPKQLTLALTKYLTEKGINSISRLVQVALKEKLEREGYRTHGD